MQNSQLNRTIGFFLHFDRGIPNENWADRSLGCQATIFPLFQARIACGEAVKRCSARLLGTSSANKRCRARVEHLVSL